MSAALIGTLAVIVGLMLLSGAWFYLYRQRTTLHGLEALFRQAQRFEAEHQPTTARKKYLKLVGYLDKLAHPSDPFRILRARTALALGTLEGVQASARPEQALRWYREAGHALELTPDINVLVAADYLARQSTDDDAVRTYVRYVGHCFSGVQQDVLSVLPFLQTQLTITPATETHQAAHSLTITDQLLRVHPGLAWAQTQRGLALVRLGHDADAITALTLAEALEPANAEIPLELARLFERANRTAETLGALRRAIALQDAVHVRLAAARVASAAARSGDADSDLLYREALAHAERATTLEPAHSEAWTQKGTLHVLLGEWLAARDAFTTAATLDEQSVALRLSLANALVQLGEHEAAEATYEAVLNIDPSDLTSLLALGQYALGTQAYDRAAPYFERVLQQAPEHTAARAGRGNVAFHLKRWEEAINHFAPVADQLGLDARIYLGIAYYYNNQYADALLSLAQTNERYGPSAECHFYQGCTYGVQRDWQQALLKFEQAVPLAQGSLAYQAQLYRITALTQLGNAETAYAIGSGLIAAGALDAQADYVCGAAATALGDFATAHSHFETVLAACPTDAPTLFALGQLAEHTERNDEALRYYRDAQVAIGLTEVPSRHKSSLAQTVTVRLGVMQVKTGQWTAALSTLQPLQDQGVRDDEMLFALGRAYMACGMFGRALAIWDDLCDRFPDAAPLQTNKTLVLHTLGMHALEAGAFDDAVWYWRRCHSESGFELSTAVYIAEALFQRGVHRLYLSEVPSGEDYVKSLDDLNEAARLAPADARPRYYLGILAQRRHKPQEALELLLPLVSTPLVSPTWRFVTALAHLDQRVPAAAERLLQLVEREHHAFEPHFSLARAHSAVLQSAWSAALEYYRRALAYEVAPSLLAPTLMGLVTATSHEGQLTTLPELLKPYAEAPAAQPFAAELLGLVYAALDQIEAALTWLSPLASTSDGVRTAVTHLYLSQAADAVHAHHYAQANEQFRQALRCDARYAPAQAGAALFREWDLLVQVQRGEWTEAQQEWEQRLDQTPFDYNVRHRLAVLTYRLVSRVELTPATALPVPQWDGVIAHWTMLLYTPRFWEQWQKGRMLGDGERALLQQSIETRISRQLLACRDKAEQIGNMRLATEFEALDLLWNWESETAQLMASVSDHILHFACGPITWNRLRRHWSVGEAVQQWDTLLAKVPGDSGQRLRQYLSPLGSYYFLINQRRYQDVIDGLASQPRSPDTDALLRSAWCSLASNQLESGNADEAIALFENAHQRGADLAPFFESMVSAVVRFTTKISETVKEETVAYQLSLELLQKTRRLVNPDPVLEENLAAVYAQLGRISNNKGDYEQALRLVQQGLTYSPEDTLLHHFAHITCTNIADDYLVKEQQEQAITALKQALGYEYIERTADLLARILYEGAKRKAFTQQRSQAIQLMQENIQYDPSDFNVPSPQYARELLATVFTEQVNEALSQENFRYAIHLLEEMMYYTPQAAIVHRLRAWAYWKLGEYDIAIRDLTTAVARLPANDLAPLLATFYAERAVMRAKRGDRTGARQDMHTANRYDPYNRDIQAALHHF